MFASRRLQRELQKLQQQTPPGISLVTADNLNEWLMDIRILDDNHPLYAGQTFRLRFAFGNSYPIEPPEVTFVTSSSSSSSATTTNTTTSSSPSSSTINPHRTSTSTSTSAITIPVHPHIYTNGVICLDLLARDGWTPVHNVESVCISIQSMLAGNNRWELPPGNDEFVRQNRQRPRDISWVFHDDHV